MRKNSDRGDWEGYADVDDMNPLAGQTDLMARLMEAAEFRHRVISHNIANVNTPGYHRLEVSFEDVLRQSETHLDGQPDTAKQPVVREQVGLPERADGNNVDIDREMGALQKNALAYQTYSQLIAAQFQMMRRAIEV